MEILRDHYKGTGKPRILTLYNNLCNMKYIPDQGLTEYISRAERLASSLKNANETVSDSLLISMVLKGLPVSYNSFIVVITQSAKDDSFVEFKSAIRNFSGNEKSRISTASSSNHVSNIDRVMKYTTLKSSKRVVQCYGCKKEGHYARSCPNMYCYFCKIKGHTVDKCRKKDTRNNSSVKVDSAKGGTGSNDDTYAFKTVSWNKQSNYSGLLVDTGATSHIVRDKDKFIKFNDDFRPEEHVIELADGSKSNAAKDRGTACVSIKDESGRLFSAKLQNTLYIPDYPSYIFSVNAAIQNGSSISLTPDSAVMTTPDGNKFNIIKHEKLYYLPTSSTSVIDCGTDTLSVTKEHTMKELHHIMGHCNLDDLVKLEGVVDGLKISDPNNKFFCDICCRGKLPHCAVNRKPDARALKPLDLVHSDLAGPISPVAKDGFEYAICFLDDYSGMVFHYFMKHKSDTTLATAKFIADVAHIGKIKRLRTDNGGEYMEGSFKDLLVQHSIKHERSAPYTPQQNGTAERSWRTSFDMARCLLLDSRLPKNLWTYALSTSGYTRNRCFQKRTACTPYELFTGKKPNIRNMAPFGSKCFVVVDKHKRKLDDRSYEGTFIGYDRESPAFLIYDRSTGAIKKSRNVKFDITVPDIYESIVVNKNDVIDVDQDENIVSDDNVNILEHENEIEHNIENVDDIENNVNHEVNNDRPKRVVKRPNHLSDYVVDYIDDDSYDLCYKLCIDIPRTYEEDFSSPEAFNWKQAMKTEYDSLSDNKTWDVVKTPEDKQVVGGKWVYSKKLNRNNDLTKYKARYVDRGFSQVSGINYYETFSPTARLTSIRVLMQIAVQHDLLLHQMDVKTAYLNANIDYEIYIEQPQGFKRVKIEYAI